MKFELLGKEGAPSLMLIPGLGVSYEIFLPLVELLKDKFPDPTTDNCWWTTRTKWPEG